jgi:hypothetical protein
MTTAEIIWPTQARLAHASRLVVEAYNALDELMPGVGYRLVSEPDILDEPERLPTFEALGQLSAFIECVDQDVELMGDVVKRLRELHHAAAVRMADDA